MKYNPKINEDVARFDGFSHIHPLQDPETVQGALEIMYDLKESLKEITGMDAVSLQPAAGAHGEWTSLMMIKAFHEANGEENRTKALRTHLAHVTNDNHAMVARIVLVVIKTKAKCLENLADLKPHDGDYTAALMLTNPNTLH